MIKIPPYLQKGDTVGLVCPAGYMTLDKVQTCIATLQEWGYKVKVGKTVGGDSQTYFSGTDEERLNDFQLMLDDDEIKTVLCARGGYGMGRIIDKIDFKKFKKQPKWIVGYSDITVLHSHLYSNYYISSLHSPMAGAFNEEGFKNEFVLSLKNALEGKKIKYQCEAHEYNRKGEAVGELVGGNLALLAHLVGTDSDIKTRGKILFIEDVGEYLYNIDRMMHQLKRSGKIARLAGLIFGGFTEVKDTDRPFGNTVLEILKDIVKEYSYPVCFDFPVSHTDRNYALKVGVGYKLKVGKTKVTLEE
ncbi:MAG: LD-carboxypeptidase [Chitinophagaceae bacterium]|nr:LD-carboxypeptidase [Chitinophagaceae bacterium]MBL0304732.1 LD-carboxypeptidase [Chitinophagaceae bacterium]HQV60085.1 LD-carboxypeptidase [Chitinophagaceae bacterium]HQV85474.1 LD-carboxypeptidase [Chitinophagaceae bacterium]HQX71801.1 LD-carboxypeptidase [Chitinophagaceae bacterium]